METKLCKSPECPNPARQRGLCPKHYNREVNGAQPMPRETSEMPKCSVSHCREAANSRSEGAYCQTHYQVKYRGGDPETRIVRKDGQTRATCWISDCPRRAQSHRLCNTHARQAREARIEVPAELGVNLNPPCSFEGCDKISSARTLCHSHYNQWREGRDLKEVRDYGKYTKGELVCAMANCRKAAIARGLCQHHSGKARQYGVTAEELIAIWENHVCSNPGCGATKYLHMDHDHATGEFRALLCNGCNTSLGFLKECPERIRGLAEYIEWFQ